MEFPVSLSYPLASSSSAQCCHFQMGFGLPIQLPRTTNNMRGHVLREGTPVNIHRARTKLEFRDLFEYLNTAKCHMGTSRQQRAQSYWRGQPGSNFLDYTLIHAPRVRNAVLASSRTFREEVRSLSMCENTTGKEQGKVCRLVGTGESQSKANTRKEITTIEYIQRAQADFRGILGIVFSLAISGAVAQPPCSIAASMLHAAIVEEIQQGTVDLPPTPVEFPRLGEITLPTYEKIVLPNGLRVFLLEDHELGLVGGQLLVRGGAKIEPVPKVGLAAMTASVQRSGGSTAHPSDILNFKLESMAARIEASSSVSEMSVAFRCLTEDLSSVFGLFSEVVQEPLMPEDKLELVRIQFLGGIARRGDQAESIARREFPKLLYGNQSAYARVPEIDTVKSVLRSDLLTFHQQNFRPDASVLGIWGDFNGATVKSLIQKYFADWKTYPSAEEIERKGALTSAQGSPSLEIGVSASDHAVYVVDRPGLTQGYVRMGELGTTLADPDVFALDVLNGILNGFGGILFDEVRSRDGLAYSISGGWSPAVEHRGVFVAAGETQLQSIPQFLQAVQRVLDGVTREPPSPEVLARAKDAALNSFVFNFTDSRAQLGRVLSYDLFGIEQDFIFQYKQRLEEITASEVLEAAQRHLHPGSQPVLIVTDAKKVRPLLAALQVPIVSYQTNYVSGSDR